MVIKWDEQNERYFIYLGKNNKNKIFIDDKRSRKMFKPSVKYLSILEDLLKNRSPTQDRKIFSFINDKTINDPKVSGLLSKYNFTESTKFDKLYNASINFVKHWKTKMIFEVNDVKKAFNSSIIEANLTPIKMPYHDMPTTLLEDYFNTGMRTFFKFLREKMNSNPRDYQYIFEATNNEDTARFLKTNCFTGLTIVE